MERTERKRFLAEEPVTSHIWRRASVDHAQESRSSEVKAELPGSDVIDVCPLDLE